MEDQQLGINFAHFDCSYFYLKDGLVDHSLTEENTYSRINVWFISDDEVGHILTKVLKPEDLEYTFAIIMPDMSEPWDIMNQVTRLIKVLKDAIFKLTPQLELRTLERLRERIIDLHKTFEEPQFDKDGQFIPKQKKLVLTEAQQQDIEDIEVAVNEDQELMDELRAEMELPEGTLTTNLFIPVAVVCSKIDLIEHGDKDVKSLLEINLDYIQVTLRKFCLSYGAALLFCSTN